MKLGIISSAEKCKNYTGYTLRNERIQTILQVDTMKSRLKLTSKLLWTYFPFRFHKFSDYQPCNYLYMHFYYSITIAPIFPLLLSSVPPTLLSQLPCCCPLSWVLYTSFLTRLFLFFSCYPSPPSPLVIVSLFFISMSLVLFCSFVLLIRFHL